MVSGQVWVPSMLVSVRLLGLISPGDPAFMQVLNESQIDSSQEWKSESRGVRIENSSPKMKQFDQLFIYRADSSIGRSPN